MYTQNVDNSINNKIACFTKSGRNKGHGENKVTLPYVLLASINSIYKYCQAWVI